MPNHASRVGIGMKMSRNEILVGAKMRLEGHSWAEVGKAVGVSASTARKSVKTWGDDELRSERIDGAAVRCGGCGCSSSQARLNCPECGGRMELFPSRRKS